MAFINLANVDIVDNTENMHVLVTDGEDVKRAKLKLAGEEEEATKYIDGNRIVKEYVNDVVSATKQTDYNNWDFYSSVYDTNNELVIGKTYTVIIDGIPYTLPCFNKDGKATIMMYYYGLGIIVSYDENNKTLIINYYPYNNSEMTSNTSFDFELYEVETNELIICEYDYDIYVSNMTLDEIHRKRPKKARYWYNNQNYVFTGIDISSRTAIYLYFMKFGTERTITITKENITKS